MSMMKRVCHLTSVHIPLDMRIFRKMCRTLAERYEVSLIVPCEADCLVDGVRIRAVPPPRNRRERMTRTVWSVYRAALQENAEIFHFHDPELMLVGVLLKLHGKKVVYDVHEDLPNQVRSKPWIPKALRGLVANSVDLLTKLCSRFYDAIVTATPAIARRFPKTKTVVVQNFPLLGELVPLESTSQHERPATFAYVGGITRVRGASEMVTAMSYMPSYSPARLAMAGTTEPVALLNALRTLPGADRVDFLGWQSREQVRNLLGRSRAGLVLYHPEPNHVEAQPNKLFEYMSAGLPILCSDFPLWREIIAGGECGLLVDPLDPKAIAEALIWILEHPSEAEEFGRRGQEAVYSRYNWTAESKSLLNLYEGLIE